MVCWDVKSTCIDFRDNLLKLLALKRFETLRDLPPMRQMMCGNRFWAFDICAKILSQFLHFDSFANLR